MDKRQKKTFIIDYLLMKLKATVKQRPDLKKEKIEELVKVIFPSKVPKPIKEFLKGIT